MKAEELRIGNWVKGDYSGEKQATIENISDLQNGNVYLSPIPITEEWLKRFGFKIYDDCYAAIDLRGRYNRKLIICLDEHNIWCIAPSMNDFYTDDYFTDDIELPYIHQLQNLYYALTGQEL
jgi:hypothetical protein